MILKTKSCTFFKKGNTQNQVYQDLISDGGVSANKIEKEVNFVLTTIAGFQVHRLSKSTYAKDMGIEVKSMTQYLGASELSAESESQNMRLHSDGTAKFGCSYTTFEVHKGIGQLLVIEIRDVGAADA